MKFGLVAYFHPLSSSCQFIFGEMLKGQLGVPLTEQCTHGIYCVQPWDFWGL